MTSAATWVGVGVTATAVLVALLKDEFWRLVRRPALRVRCELHGPDCQQTEMTYSNPITGQLLGRWPCYYFRIWVENTGKSRADKVQVFMSKLLRQHADKTFHEEGRFIPMNLRWANDHLIFAEGISPHMGKHCDLFHINKPVVRTALGTQTLPNISADETIIEFDTEVSPNNLGSMIAAGTYQVELLVAGANVGPIAKTFEITLTGKWYQDEKEMFAHGVGIV